MIIERARKTGEKTFLARATGPSGKFYHKTFMGKRDARKWLAEQATRVNKGDYINTPNKTTVEQYFRYYIDTVAPRLEERSSWGYELDIKNHILPLFKDKKLSDITFDDGVLLQKSILDKGLSNKTNNKVVSLFKQVLEFASSGKGEKRELERNPLKGFSFFPAPNKEMTYWQREEIKEFLEKSQEDYYYDLYLLAINTGLRLGEIAGLQAKRVENGLIVVSSSLKRRTGGGFRLGLTKNKITRHFPMNDTVRDIFRRRIRGKRAGDYIFLDHNGGNIDVNHFCERQFKPTQKKLGMKNIIRFHDLRHTYASNFMMNGGELFTL